MNRPLVEEARERSEQHSGAAHYEAHPSSSEIEVDAVFAIRSRTSLPELTSLEESTVAPAESESESSIEDYPNQQRLQQFTTDYTDELLDLLENDTFEYGFSTRADELVTALLRQNRLATKDWLNQLYLEHFSDVPVLVGLLRIIARLGYHDIYPQGQVMAVAALSHANTQVKECGVRAFESWGNLDSLRVLDNLEVGVEWLQEYIDEVAQDLRTQHYARANQEDRQR